MVSLLIQDIPLYLWYRFLGDCERPVASLPFESPYHGGINQMGRTTFQLLDQRGYGNGCGETYKDMDMVRNDSNSNHLRFEFVTVIMDRTYEHLLYLRVD
jgi:hypothetical protein